MRDPNNCRCTLNVSTVVSTLLHTLESSFVAFRQRVDSAASVASALRIGATAATLTE